MHIIIAAKSVDYLCKFVIVQWKYDIKEEEPLDFVRTYIKKSR